MAEVIDGLKVQAAIDACYLWRGHVLTDTQRDALLARHNLFIQDEKIGMRGVFDQSGAPFWIVSAVESPYGTEISP